MLDGRTHRTSAERVDASLLGEEQENWLWQQLDPVQTVQRPIKLLGHGVGLSQGSPAEVVTAYADFWNKLHPEPSFRAGADNDIGRRSLFLAGDIHRNHFVTHEAERIHEVLSSGVACFKPGTGIPSQADSRELVRPVCPKSEERGRVPCGGWRLESETGLLPGVTPTRFASR